MTTTDLAQLTAADIMKPHVLTVSADTTLADIERLLSEHRIGGAPVTDGAGHIIGVVSMRDLIDRYTQDSTRRPHRGQGFYDTTFDEVTGEEIAEFVPEDAVETARDVMTAQVHSVKHDAPLREVARAMIKLQVHRILVEEGGSHVGLISSVDVLRAVAGQ